LVSSINATATTISLDNANAFPNAGTIIIDGEQIAYTDKFGNTLLNARRGVNGTVAAAHASGAVAVFLTATVPTAPRPTATSLPRDVIYRAIGEGSGCAMRSGGSAGGAPLLLVAAALLGVLRRAQRR
jgi:hypothetical protein